MNGAAAVEAAERRLVEVLTGHGALAIAVSGGVDSMTLAFLAHAAGPHGAQMIHAASPAVPAEATERVRQHAARHGWALTVTRADEFADPNYLRNPVNRCFFCKTNLYTRIADLTPLPIASGANLDDLGDYRPGLLAAAGHGVVHPLVEAGIDKAGVRALAARHGLADLAELPAQPCLSSRVETGIAIDAGDLAFVHRAETALAAELPGATVRCRITHEGVVAEIETFEGEAVRAADAILRMLAGTEGRRFAGVRPYRRGSAFLGNPGDAASGDPSPS